MLMVPYNQLCEIRASIAAISQAEKRSLRRTPNSFTLVRLFGPQPRRNIPASSEKRQRKTEDENNQQGEKTKHETQDTECIRTAY
jgi:hypothetical protein